MIAKLPKDTDAMGILAALVFGIFSYVYVFRPIFSLGFIPIDIFNAYISNIIPLALLALLTISGVIYFTRREQLRPITHHFRAALLTVLICTVDVFMFIILFVLPYYPGRVLFIFLNLMGVAFVNKHFLNNTISALIILLFSLPFIWIMLIQVQQVPQGQLSSTVPCIVAPGFICSNLALGTDGNLSIIVGQSIGSTLYSIGIGCTAASAGSGIPDPPNATVYLAATGEPSSTPVQKGVLGPYALGNGKIVAVKGVKCYDATGEPLQQAGSGALYSGSVWISYSTSNASGSQLYTRRMGVISIQVK